MGRGSVSPILGKYLVNLEKDVDKRMYAMEVLKPFVEELDSKAIPLFLAEVYQAKEFDLSSRDYSISLYEVLAKFQGPNIVPRIHNIMSAIVKALMSNTGYPLQQACSKVVPAIAHYGIEPSMPENDKPKIIYSICKPLSDILMGPCESAASGSAICLKALVECENWGFASNEVVNEVCLKVAGALEENQTQTIFHMELAIALADRNSMIFEAYARSIIRSGMRILEGGTTELSLHKRLISIQMIKFLMEYVDLRSILSEMENITKILERFRLDSVDCVRDAASEALRTAKRICLEIVFEKDSVSLLCSSALRNSRQNGKCSGFQDDTSNSSHRSTVLPESDTINSCINFNSLEKTPISSGQGSCNVHYGLSTRRRLWKNESGGMDISLKDDLFSEGQSSSNKHFMHFEDGVDSDGESEKSSICSKMTHISSDTRSATPRPERPLRQDGYKVKMFTTQRMNKHSFLDPTNQISDFYDEQTRESGSTSSCNNELEQSSEENGGLIFDVQGHESREKSFEKGIMDPRGTYNSQASESAAFKENGFQATASRKDIAFLIFGLCLVLVAITLGLLSDNLGGHLDFIPT